MDDEAAFLRNLLEELTPSPAAAATVAALATRGQQRSLSSSTALQKWFQPKPLSSCDMGSVVGCRESSSNLRLTLAQMNFCLTFFVASGLSFY